MKKVTFIFCLLFVATLFVVNAQSGIIAPGATVEKLAEGLGFTEGPAVDKDGNVYFTDQNNDFVYKWSVDDELSKFGSFGRANGTYFDGKGNLITCSDLDNELWSVAMDGSHTVLVADFEGKKLNGPNDVWVHKQSGGMYFTDPLFRRAWWTRDPAMQQEGQYVYYLQPDGKTIVKVITDFRQPNGLVGTPDGKKLYVTDAGDRKTFVYDIQPDGSLTNKTLFCEMGSDGMTIDNQGNIYLTGRGVTVFNPKGEQIEQIPIDARWTANVCFGGKDMQTLFITASEFFYRLRMNVKGVD